MSGLIACRENLRRGHQADRCQISAKVTELPTIGCATKLHTPRPEAAIATAVADPVQLPSNSALARWRKSIALCRSALGTTIIPESSSADAIGSTSAVTRELP